MSRSVLVALFINTVAFGRRTILPGCVACQLNTAESIRLPHTLPGRRLAALGVSPYLRTGPLSNSEKEIAKDSPANSMFPRIGFFKSQFFLIMVLWVGNYCVPREPMSYTQGDTLDFIVHFLRLVICRLTIFSFYAVQRFLSVFWASLPADIPC